MKFIFYNSAEWGGSKVLARADTEFSKDFFLEYLEDRFLQSYIAEVVNNKLPCVFFFGGEGRLLISLIRAPLLLCFSNNCATIAPMEMQPAL